MEMQERWRRLIESLSLLLVLLRAYRQAPVAVGAGADEDTVEAACDACQRRRDEVLITTDESFRLGRAVANARSYYLDGETGAAIFEATQALRRAERLRDAHGYTPSV